MPNSDDLLKFNSLRFIKGGLTGSFLPIDDAYGNSGMQLRFQHIPSGHFVNFKAFVTAYNETFNSDWASEQVFGRIDKIHTFRQTTRTATLSFKIPASTTSEGFENMYRLDRLRGFLYPLYDKSANALSISESPLVRITALNLLTDGSTNNTYSQLFGSTQRSAGSTMQAAGALAVLSNMNVAFNLENGEVGVLEGGHPTNGRGILPKLIEVSLDFTIIHDDMIGHQKNASTPGVYGFNWEGSTATSARQVAAQASQGATPASPFEAAQLTTDDSSAGATAAEAGKLAQWWNDRPDRRTTRAGNRALRSSGNSMLAGTLRAELKTTGGNLKDNAAAFIDKLEANRKERQRQRAIERRGIPLDHLPESKLAMVGASEVNMVWVIPTAEIAQLDSNLSILAGAHDRKYDGAPVKLSATLTEDELDTMLNDWDATFKINYHAMAQGYYTDVDGESRFVADSTAAYIATDELVSNMYLNAGDWDLLVSRFGIPSAE